MIRSGKWQLEYVMFNSLNEWPHKTLYSRMFHEWWIEGEQIIWDVIGVKQGEEIIDVKKYLELTDGRR